MQRIGTDHRPVETAFWFVLLIVYESLSTIYALLPPLFGLVMAYLYTRQDERTYFLVFAYLLFYEANHSHVIFSTWLFAWLFLKFIMPLVEENIVCKRCLHVLAIVISYLGYYLLTELFNFLLGIPDEGMSHLMLFYYILVESLLVLVVL